MDYPELDFSKKISYVEDWLKKAQVEFDQGSSIKAGNNIILAIAEMENLKRTIFQPPAPMQLPQNLKSNGWVHWRPVFALTLLALAVGLFSYTMQSAHNSTVNIPIVSESHEESISERLMAKELSLAGMIEPEIPAPNIEAMNSEIIENTNVPVVKPVVASKPKPEKKVAPRKSNPVKSPVKIPTKIEKPSVAEVKPPFPAASLPDAAESKLVLDSIQFDTIIAAKQILDK